MAKTRRWIVRVLLSLVAAVAAVGALAAYLLWPGPKQDLLPIRIDAGMVQGFVQDGIAQYRGLPFAAPPVGNLRWWPPQAPAHWDGVLKADAFKPACMQDGSSVPGMEIEPHSEDCLTLNIWAPPDAKSAAVMVFIYGGGGTHGSGSAQLYRGGALAKHGVIVVTMNYRLGAFGLLAHPALAQESEHRVSGNYSLLDNIAALQWIRRNIAAFGGDPANVTIFGQSAGAFHASELLVSPLAKGLFQRVIAESGGAFAPPGFAGLALREKSEAVGVAYGERFNAYTAAELRGIPAEKIVAADAVVTPGDPNGPYNMTVDGYVLPSDVYSAYASGAFANADLLAGYNASEAANRIGEPLKAADYVAQAKTKYGPLADRFLALYPADTDTQAADSQIRLGTEDSFAWQIATWARLHAKTSAKNVFVYHFARQPPFPPFRALHAAGHGAELPYVFDFPPGFVFYLLEWPWNARADIKLRDQIETYWTNFARTGIPNGDGLPAWPNFTAANESILELNIASEAADLPDKPEHALMDEYMAAERAKLPPPSAAPRP